MTALVPVPLLDAFDAVASTPFMFGTIDRSGASMSVPFSHVWRTAHAAAGWFVRERVSRVAFILEPTTDMVATFFGAALAGATVVSLPAPGRSQHPFAYLEHLRALIDAASVEVVVAGEAHELLAASLPVRVEHAASLRATPVSGTSGAELWQSTSGSTGSQRLVRLAFDQVAANAEQLSVRSRDWPPMRSLSWLPLPHDLGLHVFLLFPIYRVARVGFVPGDALWLMDPRRFVTSPLSWLEAMIARDATFTGATSSTLARCARLLETRRMSGPLPVRFMPVGGEMNRPAVLDVFARAAEPYGFDRGVFMPGYGSAEMVAAASFSDPGTWSTRRVELGELTGARRPAAGTGRFVSAEVCGAGRFLPGVEHRIIPDRSGGTVGELLLRGPTRMCGYAGEPDLDESAWYATSDIGVVDDGVFFPLGRRDDLLKAAGEFVAAWQVDDIASRADGVKDAVAVDGDDGYVVLVEPFAGVDAATATASVAALRREFVASVGHAPSCVVAVAPKQLPKTSSGKAQRALTAHLFRAGELETL